MANTKQCPRCDTAKSLDDFHRDKSQADGLQTRCKPCQREAKRVYRAAHPDRVRASKNRYRAEHLDQERARDRRRVRRRVNKSVVSREGNRRRNEKWRAANIERKREQANQWYLRNKEQAVASSKRWITANPQKARDKSQRWRKTNPERFSALSKIHCRMRYALRRGATVERVDPEVVFRRDKGICGICKRAVDYSESWHIDHVVPLSKGGAHSYSNVQLAHGSCNCSKGAKVA